MFLFGLMVWWLKSYAARNMGAIEYFPKAKTYSSPLLSKWILQRFVPDMLVLTVAVFAVREITSQEKIHSESQIERAVSVVFALIVFMVVFLFGLSSRVLAGVFLNYFSLLVLASYFEINYNNLLESSSKCVSSL